MEKVKFTGIQAIFFRNNAIKDISVFGKKKFESLRQLDLRNNNINNIEDIKVFENWKDNIENLLNLYLIFNSYDKAKFESTIEKIKEIIEREY